MTTRGHTGSAERAPRVALALVLTLLLAGCAQHARVICDPLEKASSRDFAAAVQSIDETRLADSDRDRFLYHTQRAHLLHLAGDYEASNREFELAVRIGDELEPTSVTATLADYTINEAVKAYPGEDYERAYLHYYMALNYLALDNPESALVECRRLDLTFRELEARYGTPEERFQDDGFIRYLSGLIYESTGRLNDAFVDYKAAVRAYVADPSGKQRVPDGLQMSLTLAGGRLGLDDQVKALLEEANAATPESGGVPPEPSEIVVVIDAGWAPYKREVSVEVPVYRPLVPDEFKGEDWLAALIKIAYPEFLSVPLSARGFEVRAERIPPDTTGAKVRGRATVAWDAPPTGTAVASAEPVRDLDALARATLERRAVALKLRSTMRATAKQIVLMKQKADHAKDDRDRTIGARILRSILERTATILTAESEQADTRSWITLPREIWLARISVTPGSYQVTVRVDGGVPLTIGTVRVGARETVFRPVRVFCGPHPVRCDTD